MAESKFYEESAGSARQKKEAKMFQVFHIAGIIFFVFAAFGVFLSFLFVPSMIDQAQKEHINPTLSILIWCLWIVSIGAIGVVFWILKKRFNISYDYVFVEDELRVTKVFNGRRRKFLLILKSDSILKIGYCESDSYRDTLSGQRGKKPKFLTPNREPSEGKEFIYILQSDTLGKELYILECRKMLLEYLVRAAGVNKFVRK